MRLQDEGVALLVAPIFAAFYERVRFRRPANPLPGSLRFPELIPAHLRFSLLGPAPMSSIAILREVKQLYNVSDRLDSLADQHPVVSEALITI
jgi:hypothetical protein